MACNIQDKIQEHKYFLDTKPVQLKTPTGQVKISCDLNLKERETRLDKNSSDTIEQAS